jgi:uncharacterized protein
MKIAGSNTVPFPVAQVWDALLDPAVLVRTIPGCERLETLGSTEGKENTYAMTVTAGVAAIRGTYDGTCALSDLVEHESLVMRLRGAGAPGTIDATVNVAFEDAGDGSTRIGYDADAIVGGMVGGVGQRMLTSVSRRMAQEFFDNVAAALAAPAPAEAPTPGAPAPAGVYERPPAARAAGVSDDFLKGIAVGAGLVLLGVVVGHWTRRR